MIHAPSDTQRAAANPRLAILRREVEQTVLKPFQSHSWRATVEREIDHDDCIEIVAEKGPVTVRIAILYSSSGISNAKYRALGTRVDHIFFHGQPYELDSFTHGVKVPVESLGDFFPLLIQLNKRVEPDKSPPVTIRKPMTTRRLTAENPLDAVLTRLQQFRSEQLAAKLVERRALIDSVALLPETITSKEKGIAFSMHSALDYVVGTSGDKLNKRVLCLYYGTMALAQAEMLAAPSGPVDLDEVEGITKYGHGLYTLPLPNGGFADLRVGVLATGFLPQWLAFLRQDTSGYPKKKPRSISDLEGVSENMACTLRDLFACMPEIDDLFAEVFGGPPGWIDVANDEEANMGSFTFNATGKNEASTYALFIDKSGLVSIEALKSAGWPLAEIQPVEKSGYTGTAFRARVDHAGHDDWWSVLPIHSSPFGKYATLLLPTVGGIREYRTIAAATLYALSIMARYMPSAWRRIEGGDEDQYLALVRAALAVWERVLPEQFLASIAGETVRTSQPGSWMA